MNLTIPTSSSASAAPATALPVVQANGAAGPIQPVGAIDPAQSGQAAAVPLVPEGAAPAPVSTAQLLQFGQWFEQAALHAEVPVDGAAGEQQAPVAAEASVPAASAPVPLDSAPLLGAMAMPMMMPSAQATQATLAAVAAALPGAPAPTKNTPMPAAAAARTEAPGTGAGAGAGGAAIALELASPPTGERAVGLPAALAASALQAPGVAMPQRDSATALGAAKPDSQPTGAAFASVMTEAAQETAAPLGERSPLVAAAGAGSTTVPTVDAAGESVTLSGPPTAWRQSLQEALGERLQLQLGRNAEQAVIRLEPPMLGQVDIAIRHSAGSLEVHISATNRDVLRQLQAVSENLRADLAQRQFTEVAISVTSTRGSQAGTAFGAEQQGRGRQQDGRQDGQADERAPGLALAEAHHVSAFALHGR